MQRIYLMQHGKPMSKEENPERPLSAAGIQDVERMAIHVGSLKLGVDHIWHSDKARARETAEIMARAFAPAPSPVSRSGLAPLDDVAPIAQELQALEADVMIAGHLPHLGRLAAFLLTGRAEQEIVRFQQGGIVCLGREEKGASWCILWMLVPETLPPIAA